MVGTYLAHHGIKGQKWGVRRYQNPDGSLTSEGKNRYADLVKSHITSDSSNLIKVLYEDDDWEYSQGEVAKKVQDTMNSEKTSFFDSKSIKQYKELDDQEEEITKKYNKVWKACEDEESKIYSKMDKDKNYVPNWDTWDKLAIEAEEINDDRMAVRYKKYDIIKKCVNNFCEEATYPDWNNKYESEKYLVNEYIREVTWKAAENEFQSLYKNKE